jgi:hypothetical protein
VARIQTEAKMSHDKEQIAFRKQCSQTGGGQNPSPLEPYDPDMEVEGTSREVIGLMSSSVKTPFKMLRSWRIRGPDRAHREMVDFSHLIDFSFLRTFRFS